MNGQRGRMRKLVGRAVIGMAAAVMAASLLAPTAVASPIGDAEAAMMAAWEKAGGDTSPLGARKGDVYPVADGFALDFDGGRMFYTTDTGPRFLYGPILDKYETQGGPAGSDLGFPTINEVPGLAGPDSRVATFSASDKPVIFWTAEHGAFVVRGALNAAWDKLGSSGGVLGAPVGDETHDGEVSSQKFSGGEISWNRNSKEFTTTPPALADQLKGLQVTIDPAAAINMAWRAAGGATGPLGAKQGGPYSIGGDGIAQNFTGGKVFFNQATGANALESDILAKYESLGGPVGSDLGFPTANETDGGLGPASRIATFAAADKPVIFWTRDHGAFVVRGAMKAAWDKLRGPAGKLGAPVGDQAVDGDVVSQQFTGGKISWNRAKNSFTTEPSNLAPLLSGLQVSGQNQPSTAAMPSHGKKFDWRQWWPVAAISLAVLIALVALAIGWRRRRARRGAPEAAAYEPQPEADAAYEPAAEGSWRHDVGDNGDLATDHFARADLNPPEQQPPVEAGPAARVSWSRGAAAPGEADDDDPDAVQTDSIPIVSAEALSGAGYGEAPQEAYPEAAEEGTHAEPEDAGYAEAEYTQGEYTDAEYTDGEYTDAQYADAGYPDAASPEAEPAEPSEPSELSGAPDAEAAEAPGPDAEQRAGRHAAMDDEEGPAPEVGGAAPAAGGRPTIHLPLNDPYQAPDGYPIKASARFGLYYTPGSDLYQDTLAEIWLSSEEVAQANGFIKAD
ncbi:sunset domain-containing protein [Mycobacterium alsense]|uniref:sunset domain-containing protein n=1 Tax=Mycobacterium alsense TaxID=324058 RepID=UPI00267D1F80